MEERQRTGARFLVGEDARRGKRHACGGQRGAASDAGKNSLGGKHFFLLLFRQYHCITGVNCGRQSGSYNVV